MVYLMMKWIAADDTLMFCFIGLTRRHINGFLKKVLIERVFPFPGSIIIIYFKGITILDLHVIVI